uniref:Uncharacterized protein n=1 Tax=Anopheles farauti TaxID=69004 RepID=A0A182QQS0_9DIPT
MATECWRSPSDRTAVDRRWTRRQLVVTERPRPLVVVVVMMMMLQQMMMVQMVQLITRRMVWVVMVVEVVVVLPVSLGSSNSSLSEMDASEPSPMEAPGGPPTGLELTCPPGESLSCRILSTMNAVDMAVDMVVTLLETSPRHLGYFDRKQSQHNMEKGQLVKIHPQGLGPGFDFSPVSAACDIAILFSGAGGGPGGKWATACCRSKRVLRTNPSNSYRMAQTAKLAMLADFCHLKDATVTLIVSGELP